MAVLAARSDRVPVLDLNPICRGIAQQALDAGEGGPDWPDWFARCIRSEQAGALTLMLVSFADLLLSIQLWKNIHENSQNKLLTVSAIIAKAESENISNLLDVLDKDTGKFREIITTWLQMVEKRQYKERKARKNLQKVWVESVQEPSQNQKGERQMVA